MLANAVVVIPTFNERNGIVKTILDIKRKAPGISIIVVDDNSPDRTAELVISQFGKDEKIQVFVRKAKEGRGSAVIFGFKKALKIDSIKYFIEMDADQCHNPIYIKKLIDKCRHVDVVVASRYLPKSKVVGWSFKRRILSRGMNIVAKTLLQVPISDYTDGFRCYSRKAALFLSSQEFYSKGFVVLSETAYRCFKKGYIIMEIPIHIHFKQVSKSNLNLHEVKEAVFTLFRLRFSKSLSF